MITAALGLLLALLGSSPELPEITAGRPPVDLTRLTSFEFQAIPTTQYAGDSFDVTILAKDEFGGIFDYNGNALLTTSVGPYITPSSAKFTHGTWTGYVVINLASSMALRCFTDSASGSSNAITVLPGVPSRLVTILPGEQLAPAVPGGRSGLAYSHAAAENFSFSVFLTDDYYNKINLRDDSVYFGSTDRFAMLPAGGQLSNGSATFQCQLRTAGRHRLFAYPMLGSALVVDSSSAFNITPGEFHDLLLVAPGETILPGDTATSAWQTPGKKGTPNVQFLRTPFPVTVYATDAYWNPVNGPGDTVFLRSDFAINFLPGVAELRDFAVFMVQFNQPGPNQNLWVVDERMAYESYRTPISIRALGSQLQVIAPDSVRAGETTFIRVIVRDVNATPIVAALVQSSVVRGNGDILDPDVLTDTIGVTTVRFLATRAQFAEHDTIRIASGNADTLIGIYVDITDTAVMKGRVIAFPNPFGNANESSLRTEISYYLQNSSDITLRIYDPFGNPVMKRQFRRNENGGRAGLNRHIYWDGTNEQGHRVASGIYVLQVIGDQFTGTTFKNSYRIGVLW